MRKLTELHRHLDASFRPSTLAELSGRTEEDIRSKFWITRPMSSLKEVLDCFVLFQKVLRNAAILERVAREAVEDAASEGIGFVELRYSPTFTSELSGLSWEEALNAFKTGVQEAATRLGLKAGLICIVSRGFEMALAEKTIDFAIEHKADFIGVDLAGMEEGFPCRLYQRIFRKAVGAGLPVTVHAGEASGAENVWEAIDLLGARRIGHGIRSVEDPVLIKRLARDRILLETCPTSNVLTRSVPGWKEHPLPLLLSSGVPVSVSTDDPGIFGVTLGEEYARCKSFLGMSENELARIDDYAHQHSFLK